MSKAAEKYRLKYDSTIIAASFENSRSIAIEEETKALIGNKALEKKVKTALAKDGVSSVDALAYFYAAESGAALVKKSKGETLFQEASLLRFKWLMRGLELELLDKVLFVAGIDVTRLYLWKTGDGLLPQPLDNGVVASNGSEVLVVELTGLNRISGYMNFKNMQNGDTIIVREYVKLLSSSSYSEYDSQQYDNAQAEPVVYFKTKPTQFGTKITMQQTSGAPRDIEYDFFKEA